MIAGSLTGDLVFLAFAGVGAGIGAATADDRVRGAILGGLTGAAVGAYPSLATQRAMLRDPDCPDPSMGRLIGYNVVKFTFGSLVSLLTRRSESTAVQALGAGAVMLTAPVAGQAIVRTGR